MDININVTGLDSIASSINNLANAIGAQSLASGIEAAAAVAKVQSESKKSTRSKTAAQVDAASQTAETGCAQTVEAAVTESLSEDFNPKTSGQEASAASAVLASSESSTTEKVAQSEEASDAPAPMTVDELRTVAADASKRNLQAAQELVTQYGGKVSLVPAEKRAELAAKLEKL